MIADIGTASNIEIVFSLAAFVGLLYSAYNLQESRGDIKFIEENKIINGRAYLARSTRLGESARFIKQAIFLGIGVIVATLPDPPAEIHLSRSQEVIGFLVRWGLTFAVGLTAFQSWLAYRLRKVLTKDEHEAR